MFPKLNIEQVLVAYGAEHVPVGDGWRKMRCPFHDDSNASAAVHHDNGAFCCHGCGVRGDGYSLIKHQLGVDDWAAVLVAAEQFIDPTHSVSETDSGWVPRRKRRYVPPGRRGRKK